MQSPQIDRRNLMAAAALGGASLAGPAAAQASPQPTVAPRFAAKPLPFDPKGVPGLSERLLLSHHDNNYNGAVSRLASITGETAALDPAATPGYRLNGLKREELIAWNSMILHEVYFDGLSAKEPMSTALGRAIEHDFGSQARWAAEFSAMGKALGGGSGWVLLTWSPRDRRLVNSWAADHSMTLAGGTPLLALDMYEHAYHIDFGSRAAAYVDAFMQAFSWRAANAAFAKASA